MVVAVAPASWLAWMWSGLELTGFWAAYATVVVMAVMSIGVALSMMQPGGRRRDGDKCTENNGNASVSLKPLLTCNLSPAGSGWPALFLFLSFETLNRQPGARVLVGQGAGERVQPGRQPVVATACQGAGAGGRPRAGAENTRPVAGAGRPRRDDPSCTSSAEPRSQFAGPK